MGKITNLAAMLAVSAIPSGIYAETSDFQVPSETPSCNSITDHFMSPTTCEIDRFIPRNCTEWRTAMTHLTRAEITPADKSEFHRHLTATGIMMHCYAIGS
ncbi:MAG: hypothetical protein AAF549_04780 [Pseudomonadota bacterium]